MSWWEDEVFCPLWGSQHLPSHPTPYLRTDSRAVWPVMPLVTPSSCHYLELFFIVLEGFHDHTHWLHGALQPAVHPVKAVHAARHIHHQAQALGFLLGAAQLRGATMESLVNQNTPLAAILGLSHRPQSASPEAGRSAVGSAPHRPSCKVERHLWTILQYIEFRLVLIVRATWERFSFGIWFFQGPT